MSNLVFLIISMVCIDLFFTELHSIELSTTQTILLYIAGLFAGYFDSTKRIR